MEETNGSAQKGLLITWDPEAQAIQLKFDTREFKTWDFVLAALDMAKRHAEANQRLAQVQAMQKQAQQQAMNDRQAQLLIQGGLRG